jgi:hypothetical protein
MTLSLTLISVHCIFSILLRRDQRTSESNINWLVHGVRGARTVLLGSQNELLKDARTSPFNAAHVRRLNGISGKKT